VLRLSAKQATAVAVVAACQTAAYLTLWSTSWAKYEAVPRQAESPALAIIGTLLGFPVMFLPAQWIGGFGRLVGRPYVSILAGINGLLWGLSAVLLWRRLRGRPGGRKHRAVM
jgi:hypothetical protein